jgi:hypothetical protein
MARKIFKKRTAGRLRESQSPTACIMLHEQEPLMKTQENERNDRNGHPQQITTQAVGFAAWR